MREETSCDELMQQRCNGLSKLTISKGILIITPKSCSPSCPEYKKTTFLDLNHLKNQREDYYEKYIIPHEVVGRTFWEFN
jgi:hypothetical protein